jgi:N-acetylglucosaminyldiphosphoundecaprenol N-acetyl-beta-D-mannosaminyltransferase
VSSRVVHLAATHDQICMSRIPFLNMFIHDLELSELLDMLRHGGIVFTPNVDHLMKLQRYESFFQAYQAADYCICDSQILVFSSYILLGTPISHKISGSDLLPAFYQYYRSDPNMTLFLLGAKEGVARISQENINRKVQRQMVVDCYSPTWGFEDDAQVCQMIVDRVNRSKATVLVVGLGAPKQEQWIAKYRDQLRHVKVFLAVGASIDFEAGVLQRSPRWMSDVGLEWLYRLVCEPRRLWSRYVGDALPFFILVLKQRFRLYRNPWSTLPNQPIAKTIDSFIRH